jgi:hypothetical protein
LVEQCAGERPCLGGGHKAERHANANSNTPPVRSAVVRYAAAAARSVTGASTVSANRTGTSS